MEGAERLGLPFNFLLYFRSDLMFVMMARCLFDLKEHWGEFECHSCQTARLSKESDSSSLAFDGNEMTAGLTGSPRLSAEQCPTELVIAPPHWRRWRQRVRLRTQGATVYGNLKVRGTAFQLPYWLM